MDAADLDSQIDLIGFERWLCEAGETIGVADLACGGYGSSRGQTCAPVAA